MFDFVLGIYLAGLAVRGWRRGLVRELADLAGLLLGAALAFRLAGPVGDFLTDRFGVTSEWARLGAGVVLFTGVGIGLAVVAGVITRAMSLPGLNLINRAGGTVVAAAWGALLLALALTIASALPVAAVNDAVQGSKVASLLAGPDSPAVRLISTVGGAGVVAALGHLERLLGSRRVVVEGDERIELEPVIPALLDASPEADEEMYRMLNQARLSAGVDPLAWSADLAAVASQHAFEQYTMGYLAHRSPTTGLVSDRTRAADIRLTVIGEVIVLAATTRAAHAELMASEPNREELTAAGYDRVGVGVVQGPYGLIVAEVLGG